MTSSRRSFSNTYASLEMNRNGELRDDTAFVAMQIEASDACFMVLRHDGQALIDASSNRLLALDQAQRAQLQLHNQLTYLGAAESAQPWFLIEADADMASRANSMAGGTFIDLRRAGLDLPEFDAGLFAYARALANWHIRTRFCSVCGASIALVSAGHRAKCTNPQCATDHFPRTDPAIIVSVVHGDACLLGRQASWPAKRYSTLAGFVEPGESLEDCVRREVFEEAGVTIAASDYFSSQPWPFPASIMLGFTATAVDAHIAIGDELEDARWFTAPQIVSGLKQGSLLLSSPQSISYRLIQHWMASQGIDLDALVHDTDPLSRAPA